MFSPDFDNLQPQEVFDVSAFESDQYFRPLSSREAVSTLPNNVMVENLLDVVASSLETSIIAPNLNNQRQPQKKIKSNTASPSPSTSPSGSTSQGTQSSTNSGVSIEHARMMLEGDHDLFNSDLFNNGNVISRDVF